MAGRRFEHRIGSVVGTGPTKTAARQAAEEECARILDRASDAWRPIVLEYKGESYIVVRSPQGWDRWRVIATPSGPEATQLERPWPVQSSWLGLSRAEVEAQLRLHMAKSSWSPGDDPSTHPLLEGIGGDYNDREVSLYVEYRREFSAWCDWQLAYRFYRAQLETKGYAKGEADHLAHGLALKGPHVKAPEAYGLEPYKGAA